MPDIKCFFVEPSSQSRRWLRRYASGSDCGGRKSYHDAMVLLDDIDGEAASVDNGWPRDDHRWPTHCECGYEFQPEDTWQLFVTRLMRRSDNGQLTTLHDREPGIMWFADWMIHEPNGAYSGPDGHCLVVQTPGGEWMVDSRASNCTMRDDDVHRCWIRHGTPPEITVDKNGHTCGAGAGSIVAGSYHGFLRNGYLVEC